jgi:hypothetical protein
LELGVEVAGTGEGPARQERAFQVVVQPLDQPLASGRRVGRSPPWSPACRGIPDTRR